MSRPVCAIIGAGEGLGRALSARFAGENFDIGLVSRSREGSSAAAAAAVSANPDAKVGFFAADARQPETVELALRDVASGSARWKSSSTTPAASSPAATHWT